MNVLYMAISRDGFIAGTHDETPWSDAEWSAFQTFVKSCDVVLLGKRTFEIMKKDNAFIEAVNYIVVTSEPMADVPTVSISNANDMPSASKVGIIGGGELNGRLAELGVIDEVILDVEAIDLKAGIALYGNHAIELPLKLIASKRLGKTTIQNHYAVVK